MLFANSQAIYSSYFPPTAAQPERNSLPSRGRRKGYLSYYVCVELICCSELYLQSTTKTKPSALIAVAQVEYFLPTLSPASVGLYTLSSISEPHRRLLLFTHHCYFIAAAFPERRKKNLNDFLHVVLLFKQALLIFFF